MRSHGGPTLSRRHVLRGAAACAGATTVFSLVGCAIATPAARRRVPRVAILLTSPVTDPVAIELTGVFRAGLRELGYIDGETIAVDLFSVDTRIERFPELAREIVSSNPDLIVVAQPQAAAALHDATTVIPIVLVNVEPSAVGLTDFSRPGGNITGLVLPDPAQNAVKRVQLLKEMLPSVKRVAVVWNTPVGAPILAEVERTAPKLGVQIHPYAIRATDEIDGVLAAAKNGGAEALMIFAPVLALPRRTEIAKFALENRLPTMIDGREFVEVGVLMSYSGSRRRNWRRVATYVDRILKGERAGDLPVEDTALHFEFIVNLCTAEQLGIAIPATVLTQVTEAIPCAP